MDDSIKITNGDSTFDLQSWLTGLALGLAGKPLLFTSAQKEPTARLYGTPSASGNIGLRVGGVVTYYKGAVLPKLPEWDKAAYPNEYLLIDIYAPPKFLVFPVPLRHDNKTGVDGVGYPDIADGELITYYQYEYSSDSEEWICIGDFIMSNISALANICWSNQPIYSKSDGSLYMSAPDPIPITKGVVDYINDIPIYE